MYLEVNNSHFDIETGALLFSFPWSDVTARISSWRQGCRVEVLESGKWLPAPWKAEITFFGNDFLTRAVSQAARSGVESFLACVPENIAKILALYQADQFSMLQVCAATPRAQQLLSSNPNLLWLISPALAFIGKENPEKIHCILGLRQHALIEKFFGREDKWLVQMIEKIRIQNASVQECLEIRRDITMLFSAKNHSSSANFQEAFCDISVLQHVSEFSPYLLSLVAWWAESLDTPIIRSIIQSQLPCSETEHLMELQPSVFKAVFIDGLNELPASPEELSLAGNHWQPLFRIYKRWQQLQKKFPPPPFPGNDWLEPITTVVALEKEGKSMKHCVGSYAWRIKQRLSYVYKVVGPERATLEINCFANENAWHISQIKGYRNKNVSPGLQVLIANWLEDNQRGARTPA